MCFPTSFGSAAREDYPVICFLSAATDLLAIRFSSVFFLFVETMNACRHTSWLSFHEKEQIMFRHTSTLSDLVASFDTPAKKWPSLVVLISHTRQSILASHRLWKAKKHDDCQDQRGVCLQLDSDTAFSDRPTFLAHSYVSKQIRLTPELSKPLCHRQRICKLPWARNDSTEVIKTLHTRLLNPFADVICLFVSDGESLQSIAATLASWFQPEQSWNRRSAPRPRLLVVSAPNERRSPAAVQAELLEMIPFAHKDADFLSSISVYAEHGSNQTLKDRVRSEADIVRIARAETCTLLNAVHFDILFRRACDSFATSGQDPYDMLSASRLHRPVANSLETHIANLLTFVSSCDEMKTFAAPYIAMCLGLDNYTSDVHGWCPLVHAGVILPIFSRLPSCRCLLSPVQNSLHEYSKEQRLQRRQSCECGPVAPYRACQFDRAAISNEK
jgi:hypothetical protein